MGAKILVFTVAAMLFGSLQAQYKYWNLNNEKERIAYNIYKGRCFGSLYRDCDKNGDKEITEDEIKDYIKRSEKIRNRLLFFKFDYNRDGVLTGDESKDAKEYAKEQKELIAKLSKSGEALDMAHNKGDFMKMMRHFDKDRSAKLSVAEKKVYLKVRMKQIINTAKKVEDEEEIIADSEPDDIPEIYSKPFADIKEDDVLEEELLAFFAARKRKRSLSLSSKSYKASSGSKKSSKSKKSKSISLKNLQEEYFK